MKRYALLVLSFVLAVILVTDVSSAIPGFSQPKRPIKVYINGVETKLTLPILNKDNRNYYPFREMCEAAGATVFWEQDNKKLSAIYNGKAVSFFVGKSGYYANGKYMYMPDAKVEADTTNNRTYVPIRYAMEALDFDVDFFVTQRYDIIRIANPKPTEEQDVIMQLQGYRDNIGTTRNLKAEYLPNVEFLKNRPNDSFQTFGVDNAKKLVELAKKFVQVENNVDYRYMNSYYTSYRYFFTPEATQEFIVNESILNVDQYIQNRIDDVKNYSIISKADFLSDHTLIYHSMDGNVRIRGRIKILYNSVDPKYFQKYKIGKLLLNKWYYADIELGFGIPLSYNPEKWEHPYHTYTSRVVLSSFREVR